MKFEEIIGNDKVKKYLNEQIEKKDISHSYLFSGTDAIGKLLIAKEFSRKILCVEKGKNECECKSCLSFVSNNHPDFKIINGEAENIKIEQIRQLTNKIIEKPIESDKKIYIINDAHKMTTEAQNCLLKTLEEPPEFAVLILITSNESALLNTIKSRCMKIKFQDISDNELKKYCENNLKYAQLTENRLKSFSGSIGKAISFKENEVEFKSIENIVNKLIKNDIIEVMQNAKILYSKEKVFEYLDYLIQYLFIYSKNNKNLLNCIIYVNECIDKLRKNGNLDMNLDILLIKMWEDVNENCNRC